MKAFGQLESLMKTKSYDELNDSERALVDQELGEEVYEEMRIGITQLQGDTLPVNKDVKRMLMDELRTQGSPGWQSLFQKKLPVYIQAFGILVLVIAYYFMPVKEQVVIQDRIVEIPVRDTVMITEVDTLWIERIVEIPKTVYVTQTIEEPAKKLSKPTNNLSLSDQKELLDLVIRGLD